MQTILSIIILGLLAYWIYRIYFSGEMRFFVVRNMVGEPYLLSRNMYFTIFTVCTAPIFLGSLSLLKYGLWFATILYLLYIRKVRVRMELMTGAYLLFFGWLCCTMTYTTVPADGMMMLVKYAFPMLFLWLGYSSLSNHKDLIVFLKVVNLVACVYCLFIGGQGCKLMPWLYFGVLAGPFSTYAAFADFLVAIFIVPILLYWLTQEKKYIFCALWMILSTVLESVRTGLGGMALVFAIALLLRYKLRALPGVIMGAIMFIGIVLYVPSVNEKFFGEDAGTVSASDIVQGNAMSLENIETSGREYTWELILDTFYKGNEWMGSGLSMAKSYLLNAFLNKEIGVGLIHNDYVQLLAETGIMGISLLVLFYISVIVVVAEKLLITGCSPLVKVTGIMALSSMAGIAFCMYFDNVVSNSMQSMVIPYIFLGFFLKAKDLQVKEERKNGKLAPLQDQRGFEFTFGNYNYHRYY